MIILECLGPEGDIGIPPAWHSPARPALLHITCTCRSPATQDTPHHPRRRVGPGDAMIVPHVGRPLGVVGGAHWRSNALHDAPAVHIRFLDMGVYYSYS
eukprot:scaffold3587_cov364-Prasinococcus_capsulatus_cf.AAC.8